MGAEPMAAAVNPSPHIRIRPPRGWAMVNLGEVWAYRDVLFTLAWRDIKLRYKQTALGVAWVILQPLAAGLIFAVIFGHFARLPSDGIPYLLFVFAGLIAWQLFAGMLQRAGGSLVNESRLITKVYFPRVLVPAASAAAVLVDFTVSFAVMLGLLGVYHVWPGWPILLLPALALLVVALGAGLSLWLAALNVKYRDFMYATPFLIQIWMYATPVVYAASLVPEKWRGWFALNPLVGVVEGFRYALLGRSAGGTGTAVLISVVAALMALLSGALVFRRMERGFADQL